MRSFLESNPSSSQPLSEADTPCTSMTAPSVSNDKTRFRSFQLSEVSDGISLHRTVRRIEQMRLQRQPTLEDMPKFGAVTPMQLRFLRIVRHYLFRVLTGLTILGK